jgi:DNA-directed RNA polymerase subunit M/transcription elongation factor TFIIS
MLCKNCDNLLEKQTTSNSLKYICLNCGCEFESNPVDSLIFINDKKSKYTITKKGKDIFNYPSNIKIFKKCTNCPAKIVAYENDKDLNKIYGCGSCNYSWKELLVPESSDS